MKINWKYIGFGALVVLLLVVVQTHVAHAGWIVDSASDAVLAVANALLDLLKGTASWILYMVGALLNVSISLTLNIKAIVQGNAGIYLAWQSIRDVSGMFIIFILLFTSFKKILGLDKDFGGLIKNIIIAGILINFSFFLASVMIDASNILSLTFYNAILPETSQCVATDLPCIVESQAGTHGRKYDGGISAVIMDSLKLTAIYNPNNPEFKKTGTEKDAKTMALVGNFLALVITVTTIISLFIAACAFIVRLVMLLFLLAFSPIYFATWIFPGLGGLSKMWEKHFQNQLVFMPAYLFLLYIGLKITSQTNAALGASIGNGSTSGWSGFAMVVINYAIAAIFLNLPLVAAISLGGVSEKMVGKYGADAIWKGIGTKVGSWTGRNVVGRGAARIGESGLYKDFAKTFPGGGLLLSKGLGGVSGASFGGTKGGFDANMKKKAKDQEELFKKIGTIDRTRYKSEADADRAQAAAIDKQKKYVAELPKRSVFNALLKSRVSIQTARKLDLDVNADKYEDDKKKLLAKKAGLEEAITKYYATNQGVLTRERVDGVKDKEAQIKETENQLAELELKLKQVKKSKESKAAADIAKRVAELAKAESGGSEKPKEDKPKEDKP